ncbi:MAG: carbonic anhydrase [Cyanobacteria bacterium REEB459]|nr:carbonic anhydrase [Cyanobacteria bacterium REEB459]
MAETIGLNNVAGAIGPSSLQGRPATVLRWLQDGHQRFLEGHSLHPHSTRERLQAVVEGQHPLAAVLGCADSRVPVELLFDSGFGDLFVVRNAGTMSTTAAIASLEYAVGHLNVPLILVLGHEACGAVSAALQPELLLTPSLAQVVGQLRMELLQYGDQLSLEQSCRRHTLSAAGNLVHSSVLLTDRLRAGLLGVVAGYYDLHSCSIDWMGEVEPIRYPMPADLLASGF